MHLNIYGLHLLLLAGKIQENYILKWSMVKGLPWLFFDNSIFFYYFSALSI